MAATDAGDEDEWEYEYSTEETETFFVDLDLTTVNGVIKSKNAGDRRTLRRSKPIAAAAAAPVTRDQNPYRIPIASGTDRAGSSRNQGKRQGSLETGREESGDGSDGDGDGDDNGDGDNDNDGRDDSPVQAQSPTNPTKSAEDHAGRLQILDFGTANPVVSRAGHIYSCTWHDMLGTTMFVGKHQEAPFHEPQLSTEDYDLIGTSHIKLVGRRARPVPKTASRKRRRDDLENKGGVVADEVERVTAMGSVTEDRQHVLDGSSVRRDRWTNPRMNIETKQQAEFLEKLMEIKRARGETDTVRTLVDGRTAAADARRARQVTRTARAKEKAVETEENSTDQQRLRLEINELNKRVVKGDNTALERLQEIYADMEDVDDDVM